jgi:hypothetical protein
MPQYTTPSPAKRIDTDAVERVTATEIDLTGGAGFSVLAIEGMNVGGDVTVMVGADDLRGADGSIVGVIVGEAVGLIEGTSEGFSVGNNEGNIDGSNEGKSVSSCVGHKVDTIVGHNEGCRVGDNMGATVGPAVGSKDGV